MELTNSYKAFCRVADSLITPHSDALLDLLVLPYHMRPVAQPIQAHCITGKEDMPF